MSDVFETKAKKIAPDQIEVIDANGVHIAGKENEATNPFMGSGFKVIKMGPGTGLAGLLLLPILIPIAIIGFFLLAIFALIFGKAFFKAGMAKVIKR
jgi:hypothetical protein